MTTESLGDIPARPAGLLRRLRRRRGAFASLLFLLFLYSLLPFVEIIAPYAPETRSNDHIHMPPMAVQFVHEGQVSAPYVHPMRSTLNTETFQRIFVTDTGQRQPLRFLCAGDPYMLWGVFPGNFTWFARRRGAGSICWARIAWVATCSAGSCMGRVCR
jgi:hypothetical protein